MADANRHHRGCHLNSGRISASQTEEQVLLCCMNHHDGIEPYKFSLSLRDDVIEIVLLYRRQDGCVYCVTELVEILTLAAWGIAREPRPLPSVSASRSFSSQL